MTVIVRTHEEFRDMDTLKKLLLVVVATIAAILLILWTWDAFGFRSPASALLVTWLAMAWIAVVGQATWLSFPPGYYCAQPFEGDGRIYERLGVRLFKKLVRRGPLAIFSPTLRFPKERTRAGLLKLEGEMRKAETGHVLIFVVVLLYTGYLLIRGWFDGAAWTLLCNVLINGYPIMLQRYNRIKLRELIRQQEGGASRAMETA